MIKPFSKHTFHGKTYTYNPNAIGIEFKEGNIDVIASKDFYILISGDDYIFTPAHPRNYPSADFKKAVKAFAGDVDIKCSFTMLNGMGYSVG